MDCRGCTRPPGLSDEAVAEVLACSGLAGLPCPIPVLGDVLLHPSWPRAASATWHVVEWRQCGSLAGIANGRRLRCEQQAGHPTEHHDLHWTGSGAPDDLVWGGSPGGWAEPDPSWPVPCWVTTAAEAEGWRVAPRRALERPEEWLPGDWAATESEPGVPRQVVAVYRTSRWSDPPGNPLPVPILGLVRCTRSAEIDEWPASRCRRVPPPAAEVERELAGQAYWASRPGWPPTE